MTKSIPGLALAFGLCMTALAPAASAEDTPVAPVAEAAAPDAERLALAQAIIDAAFPKETQLALFQKTAEQMQAQMTQSMSGVITDEGALAVVTKWQDETLAETDAILERNVPLLMEAWAVSYADIHSKQELEDILAFVSTPSGQAFMQKSTDILSHPAFAEANQAYLDETMSLVMGKMPGLIEELQAYEASKQSD